MLKKELRQKYKGKRQELSDAEIEEMSLAVANEVLTLPIWDKTYFHIFLPIMEHKEVNTEFILHLLSGKDKEIVIPNLESVNFFIGLSDIESAKLRFKIHILYLESRNNPASRRFQKHLLQFLRLQRRKGQFLWFRACIFSRICRKILCHTLLDDRFCQKPKAVQKPRRFC